MNDTVIAHVEFVAGALRPGYENAGGRQYVYHNAGNVVAAVWFMLCEENYGPVIVESHG